MTKSAGISGDILIIFGVAGAEKGHKDDLFFKWFNILLYCILPNQRVTVFHYIACG